MFLQENAAAPLQIENAVLAPELQLAVDAFAGGADEDPELLLRDMHLGAEIGCRARRAGAPGEPAAAAERIPSSARCASESAGTAA